MRRRAGLGRETRVIRPFLRRRYPGQVQRVHLKQHLSPKAPRGRRDIRRAGEFCKYGMAEIADFSGYRESSLIGACQVKVLSLFIVVPVGHSLLFAVGVLPPHDGVRRMRRPNLSHGLGSAKKLPGPRLSTGSSHSSFPRERDAHPLRGRSQVCFFPFSQVAAGSVPKRNPVPSHHMRWRITASFLATATRARAMPRRLATFMPQARRADHLRLRVSRL